MLHSMTGYGSASFKIDELELEIEIKTLNSKYLDSKIILPSSISVYELELNKLLKDNLIRGKVDLRIKFNEIASESVKFNKEVINKYINELKEVSDFDESQLLKNILSLPNSIKKEENILSSIVNPIFFNNAPIAIKLAPKAIPGLLKLFTENKPLKNILELTINHQEKVCLRLDS